MQKWGVRRRVCQFPSGLIGAGVKVCGAKEYRPPTRHGPGVYGRLIFGQVEFPPEDAAILVEEIAPNGYARAGPMVREGKARAARASNSGPGKVGDGAAGLNLVQHDRRLAIRAAQLLAVNPFSKALVVVVRPRRARR